VAIEDGLKKAKMGVGLVLGRCWFYLHLAHILRVYGEHFEGEGKGQSEGGQREVKECAFGASMALLWRVHCFVFAYPWRLTRFNNQKANQKPTVH